MSVTAATDQGLLADALGAIEAAADELDRRPEFPAVAFRGLARCGVLGRTLPDADGQRIGFDDELDLVARVAQADGSVGRILDGHFNAVERLSVTAPGTLDIEDLRSIAAGELLLGVWGADPGPGEGEPARLQGVEGAVTLHGVKTYCSGAGGLHRALVIARDADDAQRLAYVDLGSGVTVDRSWYRAAGLRASESHRVVFDGARVLALLGGPGEIVREPWFSRDAIRTSATWSGIARGVVEAGLAFLRGRERVSETQSLAAGRTLVALGTIELWLGHAARLAEGEQPLTGVAIEARWAIAAAARELSADLALACGSYPLTTGGALARGRRDLDVFLLQHRLEPLLVRHGSRALDAPGRP